jgi:hypothetical protein
MRAVLLLSHNQITIPYEFRLKSPQPKKKTHTKPSTPKQQQQNHTQKPSTKYKQIEFNSTLEG